MWLRFNCMECLLVCFRIAFRNFYENASVNVMAIKIAIQFSTSCLLFNTLSVAAIQTSHASTLCIVCAR